MKKVFTQKLSCLVLGALMFSPQLKAENENGDYTSLLTNPGFEATLDKDGGLMEPSKANNKENFGVDDWFRFCPYGWEHVVVCNGEETAWDAENKALLGTSYGVNQGAAPVTFEGSYIFWMKANVPLDLFELYQYVTVGDGEGQLPPGDYIVSCRLAVMGNANTDRRFTTQRLFAETASQNKVQYFGNESDYGLNLTSGEDATYAGWTSDNTASDGSMYLRPVSVAITVSTGEILKIGVKTGNKGKDGALFTGQDVGWFKVDDFRIVAKAEADPADRTDKIVNPSFELKADGVPIGGAGNYTSRFLLYGWEHFIVKEYNLDGTPVKLPWSLLENNEGGEMFGQSVGVNAGDTKVATIPERGYYSFWAGINGMPEYTIYQDITGLEAGKYQVNCHMQIIGTKLRTQRLFANNQIQFFGVEEKYNPDNQLTKEELEKLAAGELGITYAGHADAGDFKLMSVEVNIAAGETLSLGVRTSGVDENGNTGESNQGMVRLDNFRLKYLGSDTNIKNIEKSIFSIDPQTNGCWLKIGDFTSATVQVVSIAGQTVYSGAVSAVNTWIALPQGLYIVRVLVDGQASATKVLIK